MTKGKKIFMLILAAGIIFSVFSIRGCVKTNGLANEAYRNALELKENGEYISAYDTCDYALSIKPKMKKALKLKAELEPLKNQQEAENEAKRKAEEEAKQQKINNAIQTLLNGHTFDGELAVKIVEAYTENNSGIYMYGNISYDANGDYYPVIHGYSRETTYWSRWFVYNNGTVKEQSDIQNTEGYTESTESEGYGTNNAKQEDKAKAEAEAKAKQEAEAKKKAEEEQKAQAEEAAQAKEKEEFTDYVENVVAYVDSCERIPIESLSRNPSTYKNKRIFVRGTVVSHITIEKGKIDKALESLGVYETENLEEVVVEAEEGGEIAVIYNPEKNNGIRLLEGDYVDVYGEYLGITDLTSTNIYGVDSNYKMPQMRGKYCMPTE